MIRYKKGFDFGVYVHGAIEIILDFLEGKTSPKTLNGLQHWNIKRLKAIRRKLK